MTANGRVAGCYLHGLFASDGFRRAWLDSIRAGAASDLAFEADVESALEALADHLEASLNVDGIFEVARAPR
jgi:adenosylcobyric acid synthase